MKFHKVAAALVVLSLSTSSFAASGSTRANAANDYDANDYDSAYYENEGRILFKIRGAGILTQAKQKNMPAPTSARGKATPQGNGAFMTNGYGVEAATVIFFGDNVAAELSTGFNFFKTSNTAVSQVAYNYSDTAAVGKRKNIYGIPLNFTMQYHVAPFGAIRPYIGGGYNGTYLITKSKEYKIKSTTGPVLQLGVDFVMTDDTLLSLDVKKYYLKPRVSYKESFLGRDDLGRSNIFSSKVPMNPLVVSAGLGWKF